MKLGQSIIKLKPKSAYDFDLASGIIEVLYSVYYRHLGEIKGAYTVKASHVDAILPRVGAALVVRIDATARTEEMLCLAGVKTVTRQHVFALGKAYTAQFG